MRIEIEPVIAPPAELNDQAAANPPLGNSSIAQTLKMAIAAAQSGDRNTARVELFKVTAAEPSNVDAWLWLASISEFPEELLGFLVKVLEIDPLNERARQWDRATRSLLAKTFVERGIQAIDNDQYETAAQCFDEALEYDLSCESAWQGKSQVSKSVEEKELCLARVLDINPGNLAAHRVLTEINSNRSTANLNAARVAAFAGDMRAAEQTIDSILKADPEDVAALKLRSQLSVSFNEKLETFRQVLKLEPNDQFAQAGFDFLTSEQSLSEAATTESSDNVPDADPDAHMAEFESHEQPTLSMDDASFPAAEGSNAIRQPRYDSNLTDFSTSAEVEDDVLLEDDRNTSIKYAGSVEDENYQEADVKYNLTDCAFCGNGNDPQAFSCTGCGAVLSMSDMETLFSNSAADMETIQGAVTQMEAEWNLRDFDESELILLGLGHFNLHNFEKGLGYFQEASSLDPNNVILAGQVNALAIRIDEMQRQAQNHQGLPKGKNILVVDDSATVRKLISSKLEKSGHNVICAVDGVDAMQICETVVPDLVLLDIAMPRMDGYSVCKLIRANEALQHVPVVMISGKDGFFDKVRGRMAGTTGYITKPFGPETLMRALETYLIPEAQQQFAEVEENEFAEA